MAKPRLQSFVLGPCTFGGDIDHHNMRRRLQDEILGHPHEVQWWWLPGPDMVFIVCDHGLQASRDHELRYICLCPGSRSGPECRCEYTAVDGKFVNPFLSARLHYLRLDKMRPSLHRLTLETVLRPESSTMTWCERSDQVISRHREHHRRQALQQKQMKVQLAELISHSKDMDAWHNEGSVLRAANRARCAELIAEQTALQDRLHALRDGRATIGNLLPSFYAPLTNFFVTISFF